MKTDVDLILDTLKDWVENQKVVNPGVFVDAAQKLIVLMGDETDTLFAFQQIIAKKKVEYIEGGDTVAKANVKIEASDEYREYCRQKAKIERIEEMIRISKIQARMRVDEIKNQW